MKKRLFRTFLAIVSAFLFAVSAVNTTFALSTADAKEPIDPAKDCSLKLTYAIDSQPVAGLEIRIWQIASVTADYQYGMTGFFSGYPIEINGIKAQSEWNEVRDTVSAYIAADKIAPAATLITDQNGIVGFDSLPVGIYYVGDAENEVAGFASYIISVPNLGDDGKWIYDVDAFPKPGTKPEPQVGEMKIVKLWRDASQTDKRPDSISVDILRNGELYKSVTLTAENDWAYTWETDGEYTWTAVERDVPEGYKVSVQSTDANTIQITNTLTSDPPEPPQTGDSTGIYFWIMLMALSGIVLVVLSGRRRKAYEG